MKTTARLYLTSYFGGPAWLTFEVVAQGLVVPGKLTPVTFEE